MVRSLSNRRVPRTLALLLSVLLGLYWLPTLGVAPARAATVGGFEIDGDQTTDFALDWQTANPTRSVDPVGNADTSVFSNGSKEEESPLSWKQNGTAGAAGKDDIGLMLSHQSVDAGHQWAYFAWDRAFSQGTESYFLELNQKSNTTSTDGTLSVPDRTAGDVRLQIYDQGNRALSVVDVRTWDGSAWVNPQSPDETKLSVAINTSEITDYFSSPNATNDVIASDQFIEVAIDLTAYGLNQCPVSGFTALNLRSQTGAGNGELKDNATGTIDIPSSCAALVINKVDGQGAPVPGATFNITPNPLPAGTAGRPNAGSVVIVDDSDANTDLNGGTYDDPDATAGQITLDQVVPDVAYTVTETGVPTGYVGPSEAQTATPAPYASKTLTFVNKHGSVSWEKQDATDKAPLGGATFQVTGTDGAANTLGVDITVVDNGDHDANQAAGQFRVVNLPTGSYTVTETVAPTGYGLPDDPVQRFTVSADSLDVTLTSAFLDPRKLGAIQVTKQDASDAQPLAGATFQLYADHGTVGQLDAEDVAAGDPQTVGDSGVASWTDLEWGDYLVVETVAPTGYSLPSQAYWAVSIGVGNAGTTVHVVAKDPRALTTIEVTKQNVGGELITSAPAQFGLYADSNANGVLDDGEPLVSAANEVNPQWTTTDGLQASSVDGTVAWSGLDFGHYVVRELAAPQGYALPASTDHPFAVSPTNAGGTLTYVFVDPKAIQTPTLVKSADPESGSTVQPGQAITYTVTVGNTGNVAVTGDVVDHLPAYVTFTSAASGMPTPSYDEASNTLTWPSVTVAPGQPQTFVYTVTVSSAVPAGTTLTNTASFLTLTASTQHHTGEPTPSVDKSSPTEGQVVPRGDTIHYQVTVANTGDYPVTTAPLVDTLPAGVTYVPDSATVAATDGGTTTATQPMVATGPPVTLTWTVTLPPGASVTVNFDATVNQTASGALVNIASFQQKQDTTTHTVGVPVPTLVKSASPVSGSTVQPGQVITYTVTIGNTGNYPVTGPVVDTLPAQVTYQSVAEGTPTPSYDEASNTLTWPSVTLAAGASKTYVYTVQVGTGTPDNSTLVNRATFLDLAASTTHRTGAPGGGPDKTANPPSGSTVQPGQAISYTVTVANTGTGPVRSQPAVDTLPDHVTLVPGSITGGGVASADGRTVTWTVSLTAGGSATYTYAVTVDADAPSGATLVNRVTFLGVEDTTTHTVASGALTIGKSVSPAGSASFGDTLTYTLTVREDGDLAQDGVVVTDYLPGYDPARPSSGTTTYVAGSAACDGTCTVTYDEAIHLLTWDLGTVPAGTTRVLTFQVVIDTPTAAADGVIPAVDIINAGAVRSARVPETPSNEVVTPIVAVEGVKISPSPTQPPTQPPTEVLGVKLPRTGPGLPVGLTVGLGALLIATGAGVSLAVRRRRSQL